MMMVIGLVKNPEHLASFTNGKYLDHISIYCSYLNHAHKLFVEGKDKTAVLAEIVELHRPENFAASMVKVEAARVKKKEAGASS